jgi:hypothetical protein
MLPKIFHKKTISRQIYSGPSIANHAGKRLTESNLERVGNHSQTDFVHLFLDVCIFHSQTVLISLLLITIVALAFDSAELSLICSSSRPSSIKMMLGGR